MFGACMQYVGGETTNNHLHVIVIELLAVFPEATTYVVYLSWIGSHRVILGDTRI
jgi:hypothetical protein